MKQNHLLQQKINGVILHLSINFMIFGLLCGCNPPKASHKSICPPDADTVLVFYIDFDLSFAANISKELFLLQYVNGGETRRSVITNKDCIVQLGRIINSLQNSIELTKKNKDKLFYYKSVISNSNQLHLINTYPLDIRCLIMYEHNGTTIPIWMSNNYIEVDNVYYIVTDEMREFVRKLCDINQ